MCVYVCVFEITGLNTRTFSCPALSYVFFFVFSHPNEFSWKTATWIISTAMIFPNSEQLLSHLVCIRTIKNKELCCASKIFCCCVLAHKKHLARLPISAKSWKSGEPSTSFKSPCLLLKSISAAHWSSDGISSFGEALWVIPNLWSFKILNETLDGRRIFAYICWLKLSVNWADIM